MKFKFMAKYGGLIAAVILALVLPSLVGDYFLPAPTPVQYEPNEFTEELNENLRRAIANSSQGSVDCHMPQPHTKSDFNLADAFKSKPDKELEQNTVTNPVIVRSSYSR